MEFFIKVLRLFIGPALQAVGFIGSFIPTQSQQNVITKLLQMLAIPYVYGSFMAIGTIVTVFAFGSAWSEHKIKKAGGVTKREFRANFTEWDEVQNFPLWQVAWLWCDLEPQASDTKTEGTRAYPKFRKLKEDLNKGLIKGVQRKNDSWLWADVSRQQLVDYAIQIGAQPKFLFPETRSIPRKIVNRIFSPKPISKTKKEEYISMTNLHFAFHEMAKTNGYANDYASFIKLLLELNQSGEYKSIGRIVKCSIKYDFVIIPKKYFKSGSLSYDELNYHGKKFTDVRMKQT